MQEFGKAIEDYTKAIEINSNDSIAFTLRAQAYGLNQDFCNSFNDREKAMEINKRISKDFLKKAEICYNSRNFL
jgi:hypothetical protein